MKVLHLTLKKKWFDKTDSGEKLEEYREITPYWAKRLIEVDHSLDESKRESDVVPENICFDVLINGHDPLVVLKAYRSKFKSFNAVFARNGYNPKKNPSWLRKWEGTSIGYGQEKWGAEPGKKYFVIKLGERIS
jgi:hypothetical protein